MIKKIIKHLILWRLAIFAVALLAAYVLPINQTYFTSTWANFAGADFLALAKEGYGPPLEKGTYIFFPLFSWLIREIALIIPNYLISGLILVHLSLVLALYFLYQLVKLDYKENIAKLTMILLMIFPTAFFFGSVYTESFFLLLVVLTFYLARKKLFFLSCLIALFASATRFAGIFLWPALIWEVWREHGKRRAENGLDATLIWLALPPLGLLAYMKYLFVNTGDALYFLKVSPDFGPNLIVNKLILLHQVFFRYAKMLLFSSQADINFVIVILELIVGTLFLILTIFAFKKLRFSYAIFMLLSYLIPTLAGTFVSLPRYGLTIFPGFILLSLWFTKQSPLMKRFYIAINIVFAIIITALFTRGYFVG